MATAETIQLGPIHTPKEDSIIAFNAIAPELKKKLQHLRHETNKHEPQYFSSIADLPDHILTSFDSSALKSVRVATTAYGLHLLGKVLLPEGTESTESTKPTGEGKYIHFRAFIPGEPNTAKLHCIHMEETDVGGEEGKMFRAVFGEGDALEWFDE